MIQAQVLYEEKLRQSDAEKAMLEAERSQLELEGAEVRLHAQDRRSRAVDYDIIRSASRKAPTLDIGACMRDCGTHYTISGEPYISGLTRLVSEWENTLDRLEGDPMSLEIACLNRDAQIALQFCVNGLFVEFKCLLSVHRPFKAAGFAEPAPLYPPDSIAEARRWIAAIRDWLAFAGAS